MTLLCGEGAGANISVGLLQKAFHNTLSITQGGRYHKAEFRRFYGGYREWDAAAPRPLTPPCVTRACARPLRAGEPLLWYVARGFLGDVVSG